MPDGTGGQVCTDIYEVRIMLKSEPRYVFEIVALEASEPKPKRVLTSFEQLDHDKETAIAALFEASTTKKVAIQYPPH